MKDILPEDAPVVFKIIHAWNFCGKHELKRYPDGSYYYRGVPIYKNTNIDPKNALYREKWFAGYDPKGRMRCDTLTGIKELIDFNLFTFNCYLVRHAVDTLETMEFETDKQKSCVRQLTVLDFMKCAISNLGDLTYASMTPAEKKQMETDESYKNIDTTSFV